MVYTVKTKVQMTTIKVNFSVIIRTIRYKLIGNRNTQVDLWMPSRYSWTAWCQGRTVLSPVLDVFVAKQKCSLSMGQDLNSVFKKNVQSQLTRLLVPASCHNYSWIVAHFNLVRFIFPTMLSGGRRPAERKEENTHVTPTFKCKSAGPGYSKARDSDILHRINHYPADKN